MGTIAPGMSLSVIGEIIHAAVFFGPGAWGLARSPDSPMAASGGDLSNDVKDLFRLLGERGIDYVLVGGIALLQYIEGRNTKDIDFVMSMASVKALPELIVTDSNPIFLRAMFRNLRVDVLLTSNPLFKEIQRDFVTTHRFHEVQVPTATVEGLLIMKLYALPNLYRQGNSQKAILYQNDVALLLDRHRPKLEAVWKVLARALTAGELHDVREIVSDIERAIGRVDRAKGGGSASG